MEELEDEELDCENQKMSNGTRQRLIVFMSLLVCAGKAIAKISEKMNNGEFEKDDNSSQLSNHDSKNDDYENE